MRKRLAIVVGLAAAGVIALWPNTAAAAFPGANGKIAYALYSSAENTTSIHTVWPSGAGDRALATGFDPAWSADGTRIVFAREFGSCDGSVAAMTTHVSQTSSRCEPTAAISAA